MVISEISVIDTEIADKLEELSLDLIITGVDHKYMKSVFVGMHLSFLLSSKHNIHFYKEIFFYCLT